MEKPILLRGKIVRGKGLGRTVGMPTANLEPDSRGSLPNEGVYATRIEIGGKWFYAVTNIGRRPTVDREDEVTIESFVLDFCGDIYGESVQLEIHKFLREVQKFDTLEAVKRQVLYDAKKTKAYFQV